MNIGDTVTARKGARLGAWRPIKNFTGKVEEFRKRGDRANAAVVVESVDDADAVVLFDWDTSGMFAERCYVVAWLSDIETSESER